MSYQSYRERYESEDPEEPDDEMILSELKKLLRGKARRFQMDWLEPFIEETIVDDPSGDGELVIFIETEGDDTDFTCDSVEIGPAWEEPWSSKKETLFEYFMEQYIENMRETLKQGDNMGMASVDLEYLSINA